MKAVVKSIALGVSALGVSLAVQANDQPATDLAVGLAVDKQLSVVVELDDKLRFVVGNEGGAFDYIAKRGQFDTKEPVSWYVAGGVWNDWDDGFGVRVPLGVSYQVSNGWHVYGELQPELDMDDSWELGISGALGAKYRF
ncbi:hypothetical protein [Vibrio taketomensis]|uniref:hypothetical protein n=1 Tax=Vibrio taketomensis TaxID=2572923 RepID=UPI00138994F0|nr:hypothetical protein [Vibrio taketomensis]